MGIMRSIIDWCDDKFDEARDELDERKSGRKAFASGFVEGFCDGAIIMYIPVLIACYYWQAKATKK